MYPWVKHRCTKTLSRDGFHTQAGGAWKNSKHTQQAKLQLKAKATSRMNSAASIKPQAGVKDELRIQDHRTVGEASRERGHVPEERGGEPVY